MSVQGQQMTIVRVSSRNAQARAAGSFSHVLVHCACGHHFTARPNGSPELGAFYPAIGSITVECPACEASEEFANSTLVPVLD